ncbi:MAG: exodeoxyribonuclease I [Gammaproteobacteria bacterium]
MTDSIYWYDFETTGIDPVLDRPLQFAGVRTSLDLKEIAAPQNLICRPGDDVIPQPGALLVTGILMTDVVAHGMNERDFTAAIAAQFCQAGTCVAGFNNLRFDDEFTRQMFYRNFHDPYAREWRGGNSRWDVIDLARAAYALRPAGINWPERSPGLPSFRLEDLARANGLAHLDAHDALADVRATIHVARLIKSAQPRLYDFAFRLRDKKAVLQQLYPLGKQAVVHVSSMYPAAQGCTAIVLPLCQHPMNNNAIIAVDLAQAPGRLLSLGAAEIAQLVFSPQAELNEARLALKSIHINRSPIVAPLATLGAPEAERLSLDPVLAQSHLAALKGAPGLVEKIQEAFSERRFTDNEDPDSLLYGGGFFSDADRRTMDELCRTEPEALAAFAGRFQDDRLDEMLFRYRARNWPEQLSAAEREQWNRYRAQRWQQDDLLATVEAELVRLRAEPGNNQTVLQSLADYITDMKRGLMADG